MTVRIQAKDRSTQFLWNFFLRLIRQHRGKEGMNGVIITLPLPELMQHNDAKSLDMLLRSLVDGLKELQDVFQQTIPCQILVTKMDLIPGFTDFFSEFSEDESYGQPGASCCLQQVPAKKSKTRLLSNSTHSSKN